MGSAQDTWASTGRTAAMEGFVTLIAFIGALLVIDAFALTLVADSRDPVPDDHNR